jgi:hypothetical protein
MNFSINLEDITENVEPVHSLTDEELEDLKNKYISIKYKLENEGYELTLEDQKTILSWRRADRETKFILNKKVIKIKKLKKPKKPKKLSKKALGELIIKEMNGEVLTEDESRNKVFNLTGEIL